MLLRLAQPEDTEFILEAARSIHEGFNDIEFDEDTTLDSIFAFLEKQEDGDTSESMLVVAFDKEGLHGVIAGMLNLTPFSTKKVASEPLFWTDGSPQAFKMLHTAYRVWADKVEADVVTISAPPNKEFSKYEKFYSNLGYKPYEYKFIGESKWVQ
jgi:hypothetical protein